MSNFSNKNKSARHRSSIPLNISSNTSKKIDASDWKSSPNKPYNSLNSSKKVDEHGKKSSLEDDPIKIIGTRPPISCHESPIGQNIVIPNTYNYWEKIPDNDWQNRSQHNFSYYQPQPGVQNHRQKYLNDRIVQQTSFKNDYHRYKGVAHGIICSGLPTHEKQPIQIITLKEDYSYRKKHQQIHLQSS